MSPRKQLKKVTKFSEFKFSQRISQAASKKLIGSAILDKFAKKRVDVMKKKSTMSSRMVNRIINSVYHTATLKIKAGEKIDSLAEFIYYIFNQKYGLKAVIDKKFVDFIGSLFKYSDGKKPIMFLRFLGYAHKIDKTNYRKPSLNAYLNGYTHMLNSKTGIMSAFDDTANKNMFPALRAYEYIKDKIELPDKTNLLSLVEAKSLADPKRINTSGLIELEGFLEIITDAYENYQTKIEEGLQYLIKIIGYDEEDGTIDKNLVLILVRHILKSKINIPNKDEEFAIEDYTGRQKQFISFIIFSEKIELDDLMAKCLENNFFEINDFKQFFEPIKDMTVEYVLGEINSSLDEMLSTLRKMKGVGDRK